MSTLPTAGIHHITAIATDPQRNLDFYTQVMGLRLVKLTVNFDDPGTYHFYFGHENGAPGSILTFFPWPGAAPGSIGPGQVVAIAFAVSMESLAYWNARLRTHGVSVHADIERFGERVMRFRDPDGLWLELVAASRTEPVAVSQTGPVPPEHALLAFHSATLSEANPDSTASLANVMGYAAERQRRQSVPLPHRGTDCGDSRRVTRGWSAAWATWRGHRASHRVSHARRRAAAGMARRSRQPRIPRDPNHRPGLFSLDLLS